MRRALSRPRQCSCAPWKDRAKTWLLLQVEQLLATHVLQRDLAGGDVGGGSGGGGGGGGKVDDALPCTANVAAKAKETVMKRFPTLWNKMCGQSAVVATAKADPTGAPSGTEVGGEEHPGTEVGGGEHPGTVGANGGRGLDDNPSLIPVVILAQRMAPLLRRQLLAPAAGDLWVLKQYFRTHEPEYADMLEMALELRLLVLLVDGIDEGATVKEELERYVVCRLSCVKECKRLRVCVCVRQ